jgi:5-methylcytosine-specific restriction endonuclease McrA
MAIDIITDKKITQDQADRLQAPMELDLTAIFKIMESDMLEATEVFEGTPDKLISEIVLGITGEQSILADSVEKSKKRDYKKEYEDFQGKPEQIKNRAKRNKARRESNCKPGDGKEVDHIRPLSAGGGNTNNNTRIVSRKTNRKKGKKIEKGLDQKHIDIMIDLAKQVLDRFHRRYQKDVTK